MNIVDKRMDVHKFIFIWDYDGTLVDSRQKNLTVTRTIIEQVTGKSFAAFDVLQSVDTYINTIKLFPNWREFYKDVFKLTSVEIDKAGAMWTEVQKNDQTEIEILPGIVDVINNLSQYRHGIVSQNSKSIILQNLEKGGIAKFFDVVIGYEEVGLDRQKPNPTGLLSAIKILCKDKNETVFYIGDQYSDVECAFKTKEILKTINPDITIYSIFFGEPLLENEQSRMYSPDFVMDYAEELPTIVYSFKN